MTRLLFIVLLLAGAANGDVADTLRPNAVGTTTQWVDYPSAGDNYADVDDITADDDATYVTGDGTDTDLYHLTATVIQDYDSIVSVTLVIREKCADPGFGTGATIAILRPTTTNRIHGTYIEPATSYTNYSRVWTTNPDDSEPWEAADLADLQAGMEYSDFESARVTQVFVIVFYVAGEPPAATGLSGVRANNTAVGVRGCNDAASITVRGKQ